MDISQYENQKTLVNIKDIRSPFSQGLGALIGVRRTRPEVGSPIAKIATDFTTACTDAGKSTQLEKCITTMFGF